MTDLPAGELSIPAQMGPKGKLVDGRFHGWVDVTPRLCRHGLVRGSVLAMLVDVAAGYEAEQQAGRDWNFTADLSVRRSPRPCDRIEGIPVVQRAGRTISIDLPLHDGQGGSIAHGFATFTRVTRRPGDPERPDYPVEVVGAWADTELDLVAALDARDTDAGIEVALRPGLLNPAGVLQGGVAALIAEVAAERAVASAVDRPMVVTGFDIRYVSMGRVGPIRAEVTPVGDPTGGRVVVRLVDVGADRLVTHNLVDFAEPQA